MLSWRMPEDVRKILLETIEASLEAQLAAVRRLRAKDSLGSAPASGKPQKGRSQLDVVEDILRKAGHPLHVTEIIEHAQHRFARKFDRESLVSSLTKRVAHGDRFMRTAPNTFGLLASPAPTAVKEKT
jgi:phosphoglycolate phosphatase-like HAD superfamily hydrolase